MKKLRLMTLALLICLLLNGCGFFFPFFYFNFPSSDAKQTVQELPIGSDVDPNLSGEDIYWRSKFATKDRALQYSEYATITLDFSDSDIEFQTQLHYDTHTVLDPDSSAVNVQTFIAYDDETPSEYWDYYRDEDGRLIYYYHDVDTDECTREEIPLDGQTPYVIILDYTIYGYPYNPQDLQVAPQTRILSDREVYMVTFQQSALNLLGGTGNAVTDQKLEARYIPVTWYVDAETYLPVRQEFTLTQVDDLLGEIISSYYMLTDVGAEVEMNMAVTGYSVTLDYHSFEPVEIPSIPADVLKKAWSSSGFSTN